MSKEAIKLALDALGEIEWSNNNQWQSDRAKVAITALREALAEQPTQQEPVAWEGKTKLGFPIGAHRIVFTDKVRAEEWLSGFVEGHAWLEPLAYTAPPTLSLAQRQSRSDVKPLTDEQIDLIGFRAVGKVDCPALSSLVPYGAEIQPLVREIARAIEAKLKEKNT